MAAEFFENAIRAEAHRGFVGHQMCCSYCKGILDARRSVSLDLFSKERTLLFSKILCLSCFNRYADLDAAAGKLGLMTLEVFDGSTNEFKVIAGKP
jgi:hypothetical protein